MIAQFFQPPKWLVLFAAFSLFVVPAFAQRPAVRIGVTIDGPWERNLEIRTTVEREVTQLLSSEYEVRFPPSKRLTADWTLDRVKAHVDQLLADPEIDFVIALGVLSSNYAGHLPSRSKPVIAPYVINPEFQDLPVEIKAADLPGDRTVDRSRVSGAENLSYVVVGADLEHEVSRFLEIVEFRKLALLISDALAEGIPRLADRVREKLEPLELQVKVIRVGDSLQEALAAIPEDTEAVYVTPLLQLPASQFDRLVQALIERRLPSFSLWGDSEVRRGLLASVAVDQDTQRLARRIALNIHRILLGEAPEEIPVDFPQEERLTINMATARAINAYPGFALLTEAELLNPARRRAARSLSLASVVREAAQVNLDLAAADRTVAAGLELVRSARSPLLPQVDVSTLGTFIDKDRAEASLGSQGQRRIASSAGVSQLIYSERARAGYDVERALQDSREQDRARLRLDVILEAAEAYLNVLRSKTVERIQQDNLKLTRSNLALARSRVELGAAGREEVFRWESQIATNRKAVIDASAARNQAEINVNRVLNRSMEEPFLTQEAGLDDTELFTSFEQIRHYIDSQPSFRAFRQFMSAEAFENSPELRQLDAGIRAQERALLAAKRAFYVPDVGVQADVTGFRNGGAGSTGLELPEDFPFQITRPNSLNWTVGVSASLPLFLGGSLRAERSRAEIELDELTVQKEATRQRIDQRIRSILHQTRASFAGIELSRDAAEAARRNLELVTDSYRQGVVSIIILLDAQNQALVADLVAANAVFDYLIDLMGVQRAAGRFDYFQAREEQSEFFRRLDGFFQEKDLASPEREP